ncbi:Tat proofreading chaperone DmsD [Leminorella grimontii]|uniref:Tat proofreading chaperone DmsD n=1 Tax=Leminorella grimontii TaxID=82981 RepID=A0AAV5N3M2_9GAMM|nr:Tat proofreading chaperone DmsD [Leminorella grimontii]GKX56103.1 Tat proofreading chaperone DmsD [Leminorella grimontii]VFS57918.1 Twin-arginine leader-binding protein DmsD [Leminorella grimontii]
MSSSVKPTENSLSAISLTGRMLGALLYYSPEREEVAPLLDLLSQNGWPSEWPCGAGADLEPAAAEISQGLAAERRALLPEAYQTLFIGPNELPTPPWGSVYLDREMVVFGESTLALRAWQASLGISVEQKMREPEDHIGLLLMMAAWLAENRPEQLSVLLGEHLLPWSDRFFTLLEERSVHPFYRGVAQLARATLKDWRESVQPVVVKKTLFF